MHTDSKRDKFLRACPARAQYHVEKNWARLADAKRRGATEGPLRPYRNHPLPQQVPDRFDGLHPTSGTACGAPPGHPTPEMNEIRQRTHVASRPGSIFRVFCPKNGSKCIRTRNGTNFCVRALLGHSITWKKIGHVWRMRSGEVRPRVPSGHTETTPFHSKYLTGLTDCTQLLGPRVGPHPGTPRPK